MALFLALTLFQHLIDGFHNRDLRAMVADSSRRPDPFWCGDLLKWLPSA
jgi:hypothetical protein